MPPLDYNHFAQQRQLLGRADQNRAALWDVADNTVAAGKAAGASNQQIMKALQPVLEPLRKLTISSGRDDTPITGELALLFARPVPPQPAASAASANDGWKVERIG